MKQSLADILRCSLVEFPFPVAVDGEPITDGRLGPCDICQRVCKDMVCMAHSSTIKNLCHHGVRYYQFSVGPHFVVVYGLAPEEVPKYLTATFRGRRVPDAVVYDWLARFSSLLDLIEGACEEARADSLDSIHDISKMASDVTNLANELVEEAGGISEAGQKKVALLKASEFLLKEFDRLELLANPASASTRKVYSHVYKLCHKISQISDIAFCKGNNKKLRMSGRSDICLRLFESVSVMIFALIENAAKYSFPSTEVDVSVNDGVGFVDICVTSTGPLIEADEIPKIFERGFRGRWAKASQKGQGIGLHLAQIVALAHRTKIAVESHDLHYERNSIPCARNVFSVRLREV